MTEQIQNQKRDEISAKTTSREMHTFFQSAFFCQYAQLSYLVGSSFFSFLTTGVSSENEQT
jgi:hypothetical protein